MTKRRRTLLIVEPGIGTYKEPLVRALAKEANLVFASGLHATVDCSWAEKYASGWVRFSYAQNTLAEAVRRHLERTGEQLDGALTYVESSVHFTNALQHELGLPVISSRADKSIRSKARMRELLAKAGVAQPAFRVLKSEADVEALLASKKGARFPGVIKPAELMSSLGVRLVRDAAGLREAYRQAATADFWDENLRELYGDISSEVLYEEFVEGAEYSAEVVTQRGRSRLIGITKKTTTENGYFDELGHEFPAPAAEITPAIRRRVEQLVARSHKALGIRDAVTHPEFRLRRGRPVLIEINCRIGGDLISTLVERSTGLSMGRVLADVATGRAVKLKRPGAKPQFISFLTASGDGRVAAMPLPKATGADARVSRHASELELYARRGGLLFTNGLNATSRLGHVIASGEAPDLAALRERFEIQKPLLTRHVPAADGRAEDWLMVFEARGFDLAAMARIESESWAAGQAAPAELLRRRFELNPRSALVVCSVRSGAPVGFLSTVPVSELHVRKFKPWDFYAALAVSGEHFARLGQVRCQYVLSITVHPEAPRGAGTSLVQAVSRWCASQGIPNFMYGIRAPSFERLHRESGLSFEQYFARLLKRDLHEDIYKVAINAGGKAIGYLPGYYSDPASRDHGVIIFHDLSGQGGAS